MLLGDFGKVVQLTLNSISKILNLNKYSTSNIDGEYEINNLCKGKIILVIKHISCETKQISIDIDKSIERDIFLEHHLEELNEVVVKTNIKNM